MFGNKYLINKIDILSDLDLAFYFKPHLITNKNIVSLFGCNEFCKKMYKKDYIATSGNLLKMIHINNY